MKSFRGWGEKLTKRIIPVVAGVIFDRAGRVLACQRPEGKSLAGFWEFPGGKVEARESLAEALERELLEELSLEVTVLDEMYYLEIFPASGEELQLHFLRAFPKTGSVPQSREQQEFCWLEKITLNSVKWLESDREFVNFIAGK